MTPETTPWDIFASFYADNTVEKLQSFLTKPHDGCAHGFCSRCLGEEAYREADREIAALRSAGFALYDTKTHVAVPTDPDDSCIEEIEDILERVRDGNEIVRTFAADIYRAVTGSEAPTAVPP